jgi:ribosomal protein S18 acetylase RimI-like enzyme
MRPSVKVQLRSATAADAALVADMHSRSRVSAYRGMLGDQYLEHEAKAEVLALWPIKLRELAAGAGELLIAERDKNAIGFICMFKPDEQGSVYIDNLHAMPEHKGSGAGTAMLDEARRWALSFGATRLHLLVLDTNVAAIGFYESRGWKWVGRKNDRMGGSDVVALVYALALEPTPYLRH